MNTHAPNETQHAYPFYMMERAFFERAVRDHQGVDPNMALGLLESTELYAAQAQKLRELLMAYRELAEDATTGKGPNGGNPWQWIDRRTALACESARLGVERHEP